jgi:hypothetical protein
MQAMINTAWKFDPYDQVQKLSEQTMGLYGKQSTGSNNPSCFLVKQSLKLSSAVLGTDTKPMCAK